MSTQIINRTLIAQVTRTLDDLAKARKEQTLPLELQRGIDALISLSALPGLNEPLFPGLGEGDPSASLLLSTALETVNIQSFKYNYEDRHNEYLPDQIEVAERLAILNNTDTLIETTAFNHEPSSTQGEKLQYFSRQLDRLSYNMLHGEEGNFSHRLVRTLEDISDGAAVLGVKYSPGYSNEPASPVAVAEAVYSLSNHGDNLLLEHQALHRSLSSMATLYKIGKTTQSVTGGGTLTHLYTQHNADQWQIPINHADEGAKFKLHATRGMISYHSIVSGDIKKPTRQSVNTVIQALDTLTTRLASDTPPKLVDVNGKMLDEVSQIALLIQIQKAKNALANMAIPLNMNYDVTTSYEHDKSVAERVRDRQQKVDVFMISDTIDSLPEEETIRELITSIADQIPEFSLDYSNYLSENGKDINIQILAKDGPSDAMMERVLMSEHADIITRLENALKTLVKHADDHDASLTITGAKISKNRFDQLLNTVTPTIPGMNALSKGLLHIAFSKPAPKELVVNNGQQGEPRRLSSPSLPELSLLSTDPNVMIMTSYSDAKKVVDNILKHEPSMKKSLNFAVATVRKELVDAIENTLQHSPEAAIMTRTIKNVINEHADMWDDMIPSARTQVVVNALLSRVAEGINGPLLRQSIDKHLAERHVNEIEPHIISQIVTTIPRATQEPIEPTANTLAVAPQMHTQPKFKR